MKAIFPIEFDFGRQRYCGIVRVRQKHGTIEMKVRVMNGRVDRLFYGHHVFNVINDEIVEEGAIEGKAAALRQMVKQSLESYITQQLAHRA